MTEKNYSMTRSSFKNLIIYLESLASIGYWFPIMSGLMSDSLASPMSDSLAFPMSQGASHKSQGASHRERTHTGSQGAPHMCSRDSHRESGPHTESRSLISKPHTGSQKASYRESGSQGAESHRECRSLT
jgi:hypothetical protein